MPAIQVRDFPQEVYDLIKQEAKENGRSIMQQTKHIVMQHFAQHRIETSEYALVQPASTGASSAQDVNPFSVPSDSAAEMRASRRSALFDRMAKRAYPDAAYQLDAEGLVRQMRDER